MLPPQKMASDTSPAKRSLASPPLCLVVASSVAIGALMATGLAVVLSSAAPWLLAPLGLAPSPAAPRAPPQVCPAAAGSVGLTFGPSPAEEALGDLTTQEVRAVARWFSDRFGAVGRRNASADCLWLAGPSAVELLLPPKASAVAYLEGRGPRPPRFARVTAVGPQGIGEYRVGPLVGGSTAAGATAELLTARGDVPYAKRPTESNADMRLMQGLVNASLRGVAPLLETAFGPIFPQLAGFDERQGQVGSSFRNDALASAGQRADMLIFQWFPPAPVRQEASWLHPLPLLMKVNTTDVDPAAWTLLEVTFCGQTFPSAAALREAHSRGEVRVCSFHKATGTWDVPQRVTPPSPDGRQLIESHGGVSWGPWTFTVTQRPSTGPALLDVRFRGERVLYELSLQDAQAAYSGDRKTQFFYADGAWSLSMLSASLEPGVDCPEGAHYLSATNWGHFLGQGGNEPDPMEPADFFPICVFEWVEDHTIWRHMQNSAPPDVRGLLRRTVVVRSIATVGNYDYITDMKLREDGEIEVRTRFAGFIESRHFDPKSNPEEANFSTILRPDLAGPVHSHLVNWKADIDVAGVQANALRVTKVKAGPVAGSRLAGTEQPLVSKYLEHEYVEREGPGSSTFVAHPEHPGAWVVVDRQATSEAGNPRGYAVTLASWATTQVLPDSHPFVKALPLTKYHLAVTRHHDSEYRSSSPYVQYDGLETTSRAQDLDRFLADGEGLLDEDLVAWIGVGREHIVRQEDLPLVSNFGAGFSLQPFNFFTQNAAASPPWEQ